jgi:hypothetical protein
MIGQTEKKESWYFKLGGSYFMQPGNRISSGFRSVAKHGCLCSNGTTLLSRETNHGSGEGFSRCNRRLPCLVLRWIILKATVKTMVETVNRLVAPGPVLLRSTGTITVDLAPAIVLFF